MLFPVICAIVGIDLQTFYIGQNEMILISNEVPVVKISETILFIYLFVCLNNLCC